MPTMLRSSKPTARKSHHCDMCTATVNPGEQYHRSTNLYDDRVYDFVTCAACERDGIVVAVYVWAGYPDEGVRFDGAEEWAHENAAESQAARDYLIRGRCDCERCEEADDAT